MRATRDPAADAASALATPAEAECDTLTCAPARFSVVERAGQLDVEPDCPFAVVETETGQVPENWFGQSQQGYHSTREGAEKEAAALNELASHFEPDTANDTTAVLVLTTTSPADDAEYDKASAFAVLGERPDPDVEASHVEPDHDSGADRELPPANALGSPSSGPIDASKLMPGGLPTAWQRELLASTAEMPLVDDELSLEAEVTDARSDSGTDESAGTDEAVSSDGEVSDSAAPDLVFVDVDPVAAGGTANGAPTIQLPKIFDPLRSDLAQPRSAGRHAQGARTRSNTAAFRRREPQQIQSGQQVLCSDGSWRTVELAGTNTDGAVLLIEDGTEHAYRGRVEFWVRDAPNAPADVVGPSCPNDCTVTNEQLHLCTCPWSCGCSPHPAGPTRRARSRSGRRSTPVSAGA